MRSEMRAGISAVVFLAVFAIIVIAAVGLAPTHSPLPPPQTTFSAFYMPSAGAKLFGLQSVRAVIDSSYANEANLLDYSQPVADVDFILPYAAQEFVHLPGFPTDQWIYTGAVYVYGSGWVLKFLTPGRHAGHIALLHIARIYTATVGAPAVSLPLASASPATVAPNRDEGNRTAKAVASVLTFPPPTASAHRYAGGTIVGVSGWPLSSYYGNGLAGPANAQLCLVLDYRASLWLNSILTGQHHRPVKPFPAKAWRRWGRFRYRRHGHLMRLPKYWAAHGKIAAKCGSPVGNEWWWKRYRFMRQAFRRGVAYHWPRKRGDPVAFRC